MTATVTPILPREPAPPSRAEAPAEPARVSPTRLMIEEVGGAFVYTLTDRLSGQVIVQLPREDLARLAEHQDYASGAVLDTQA